MAAVPMTRTIAVHLDGAGAICFMAGLYNSPIVQVSLSVDLRPIL
jgi:hypothetical protein